jgi:hypothetical protein
MSDVLPDRGTPDRDEIEELREKLLLRGYELHLSKHQTRWFGALHRDNIVSTISAPYGFGDSALEAAQAAWTIYLETPTLNSYKPHPDDTRGA